MLFDYLSVRLNDPTAAGKKLVINLNFSDLPSRYVLMVENSVLPYADARRDAQADATITLSKAALNAVQLKEATLDEKIASGATRSKVAGKRWSNSWFCSTTSRSGSTW